VTSIVRASVRVEGVVQGVGFRPFVYSLATRLGLAGWVGNDVDGVFAEVRARQRAEQFLGLLETQAPRWRVDRVTAAALSPTAAGFAIVASDRTGRRRAGLGRQFCADCLAELADPADRRLPVHQLHQLRAPVYHRHRRALRPAAGTMAPFTMCAECAAEYHDPADRRFRSRSAARLRAAAPPARYAAQRIGGEPLAEAARLLAAGSAGGQGPGGYHLAVDAGSEAAASAAGAQAPEDKPFALMAADPAAAGNCARWTRRASRCWPAHGGRWCCCRGSARRSRAVAPGNRQLGIMLPYTPLHHLLLAQIGRPIVLTSGNVSDEPIAYTDEDAGAAGASRTPSSPTTGRSIRTDDSAVRPLRAGKRCALPWLRTRAAGLAARLPRPVLACGAELKNTFCLAMEDRAFVSHHRRSGELRDPAVLHRRDRPFPAAVRHRTGGGRLRPAPEYLSTKYALELDGVDLAGVQHHHAHIASCLADNGEEGPVIGVAFDGTGFGTDGTIWGGEFLLADLTGFERAAHLAPVPMPGGAAAIRQPWRMAAAL
jgi:hydrogenase maturation protein HypF